MSYIVNHAGSGKVPGNWSLPQQAARPPHTPPHGEAITGQHNTRCCMELRETGKSVTNSPASKNIITYVPAKNSQPLDDSRAPASSH